MASGGCFCGQVRYEVSGRMSGVTYCHCSKCRRWHGHVGAFTTADRDQFRLTQTRGLKWHALSPTVRRGFCVECGSSLFFDDEKQPRMAFCPGTVDAPTGLREKAHIYVASKGDYYEIGSDLLQLDELT